MQEDPEGDGFEVALKEEEDETTAHGGEELIGYLAIESGSGTWSSKTYKAARTADRAIFSGNGHYQ